MRSRVGIAVGLCAVVLGAGTSAAVARQPTVTEFQTGLSLSGGPWDIVDGDDGRLWFTQSSLNAFGSITAGDGLISELAGGLLVGEAKGMAVGPDGNLWIAEAGLNGAIARVTKAGAVTEFSTGLTPSDPWDITKGPDGNMWFVSRAPAFIGRITPEGTITEFTAGLTAESMPTAITAGPDGNLWFTESADPGRIGRITPEGVITENSIGLPPNMAPTDITAGPDGNLWFTMNAGNGAIGRITPAGEITLFTQGLTPGSGPMGITTGTDGALWFTEAGSPGRIGRITKHGDITEYEHNLTDDRAPWFITAGPDGNMWFTENANPGAIARISLPPILRSRSVSALSDNSALLPAKIRPNAQRTMYHFEYGTSKDYSKKTETADAGDSWDHVEVTQRIAKLMPSTKYYYRVVARNDSGDTVGSDGSFTTEPLTPEFGDMIVAKPKGRVRVKRAGRWRRLGELGAELPVGVKLDTRRGSVELTSAGREGGTQTGTFGGGVLQVRQPPAGRGRVDLHLRGGKFGRCKRLGSLRRSRTGRGSAAASHDASAAGRRTRRVRRLWARDHGGRFRTYGRHSHATVRGTRWLTEDRCNGTLTRVTGGSVVVRDLVRRKRVVVRAGRSYLARRPKR